MRNIDRQLKRQPRRGKERERERREGEREREKKNREKEIGRELWKISKYWNIGKAEPSSRSSGPTHTHTIIHTNNLMQCIIHTHTQNDTQTLKHIDAQIITIEKSYRITKGV